MIALYEYCAITERFYQNYHLNDRTKQIIQSQRDV